jgi:membrane protein YqaA with SNARE-associated domain
MFNRLKKGLLAAAKGPHAVRALAGVAFLESWVFPVPPDIMLGPMVLAHRGLGRALMIAAVCTTASVLGGLTGYLIGLFGWEFLGLPLLSAFYGREAVVQEFAALEARIQAFGFWPHFLAVFGFGIVPFFPYKIITISSGALNIGLPAFIAASVSSRAIRFFGEAIVLAFLGDKARKLVEKRFGVILTLFFLLLVAGYAGVQFLQ